MSTLVSSFLQEGLLDRTDKLGRPMLHGEAAIKQQKKDSAAVIKAIKANVDYKIVTKISKKKIIAYLTEIEGFSLEDAEKLVAQRIKKLSETTESYLNDYADAAENAGFYAKVKHDDTGAIRKASGKPYFVHPKGVAKIAAAAGASPLELKIAFCHDLIEDAKITWKDLYEKFGEEVADYVSELSNDKHEISKYELRNPGFGKQDYLDNKLLTLSPPALTVKICDNIYNYLDNPTKSQKKRIQHHLQFILENCQLTKVQKNIISMLEL